MISRQHRLNHGSLQQYTGSAKGPPRLNSTIASGHEPYLSPRFLFYIVSPSTFHLNKPFYQVTHPSVQPQNEPPEPATKFHSLRDLYYSAEDHTFLRAIVLIFEPIMDKCALPNVASNGNNPSNKPLYYLKISLTLLLEILYILLPNVKYQYYAICAIFCDSENKWQLQQMLKVLDLRLLALILFALDRIGHAWSARIMCALFIWVMLAVVTTQRWEIMELKSDMAAREREYKWHAARKQGRCLVLE
jgi:hypothetical protein